MPTTLGGVGIGVSDMARSVAFYRDQLGMKPTQTFDVAMFSETVMAFPHRRAGSQIILMQYKNSQPVKDQAGKLVFYVEDVKEVMDRLKAYGCEVVLELGSAEGWVKQVGMVKDPDGSILEFMPLSLLKGSANLGSKI